MTDLVELVIDDDRWSSIDLDSLANRAAALALGVAGLGADGYEIGLLACGDKQLETLNSKFRGKSGATNILSWPAFDLSPRGPGLAPEKPRKPGEWWSETLGDLAISFDTCQREAAESGTTLPDHVTHLVLHGCLHLLGYDHQRDADAALMERLEIKALASVGIADPYAACSPIGLET